MSYPFAFDRIGFRYPLIQPDTSSVFDTFPMFIRTPILRELLPFPPKYPGFTSNVLALINMGGCPIEIVGLML